ncbi:MAG: hypothetical protein ACM3N7_04600 [Planctomycetaceae bacterium]
MRRILNEISKIGNEGKYVFSGRKDSILAPFRKHEDGEGIKSMLVAGRDALGVWAGQTSGRSMLNALKKGEILLKTLLSIREAKSFPFFCRSHTPLF